MRSETRTSRRNGAANAGRIAAFFGGPFPPEQPELERGESMKLCSAFLAATFAAGHRARSRSAAESRSREGTEDRDRSLRRLPRPRRQQHRPGESEARRPDPRVPREAARELPAGQGQQAGRAAEQHHGRLRRDALARGHAQRRRVLRRPEAHSREGDRTRTRSSSARRSSAAASPRRAFPPVPVATVPPARECPRSIRCSAASTPSTSRRNSRAFRSGERANDPNRMMRMTAARLSDAEIKAVANYIAGLR